MRNDRLDFEKELIEKARKGDTSAFRALVDEHKEKAVYTAYSALGNLSDAQDAVQEAFVRVFHGLNGFKRGSRFSTWFYRILVNLCRDELRKRKRDILESYVPDYDACTGVDNGPAKELMNKELKRKINAALLRLSDKQQMVFLLKHKEGFKLEEIAEIMRLKVSTVKVHLFRAVRRLRGLLQNLEGGGL